MGYDITKGKWKFGRFTSCVVTDDIPDYKDPIHQEAAGYYGGHLICESIKPNDASLLIEAGNVHHETGYSPYELQQQRDLLLKALEYECNILDGIRRKEGWNDDEANRYARMKKAIEKVEI